MPNKKLRVSIVIPAYNEEDHLAACLESIAQQTLRPYEVIVVDNNSDDGTVAVAERFDFVTIFHESRQGVVYARDCGFDAAQGEIIGRIDADTMLPPDWTAQVQRIFAAPKLTAVTGSIHYYDAPPSLGRIVDAVDLMCRRWLATHLGRYVYLLGSNMALRRSAWQSARAHVCHQKNLHEDEDLAIHLGELGRTASFVPELRAAVSGRQIDTAPRNFWRYTQANIDTYRHHHLTERRAMYPIVALVIIFYPLLRVLYRGFNPLERKFRWRRVISSGFLPRVNPATFMDLID